MFSCLLCAQHEPLSVSGLSSSKMTPNRMCDCPATGGRVELGLFRSKERSRLCCNICVLLIDSLQLVKQTGRWQCLNIVFLKSPLVSAGLCTSWRIHNVERSVRIILTRAMGGDSSWDTNLETRAGNTTICAGECLSELCELILFGSSAFWCVFAHFWTTADRECLEVDGEVLGLLSCMDEVVDTWKAAEASDWETHRTRVEEAVEQDGARCSFSAYLKTMGNRLSSHLGPLLSEADLV